VWELWARFSGALLPLSCCHQDERYVMLKLETPAYEAVLAWSCPTWATLQSLEEERASESPPANLRQNVLSTFGSKANLEIEVVELSECYFDELVEMYEAFQPKRAAQGLPPVGRDRIIAWLRHLQKSGHNLLALWNRRVIGHSMLCPVDPQRAEFAIFLHQGFRNQGIGTGLTDVTLNYARQRGFRHIWLSVEVNNRCAIRVYRKKGFRLSDLFGPEQEMILDLEEGQKNEVQST
jgi:RimJ/RimL family protein N-acetyltransferase